MALYIQTGKRCHIGTVSSPLKYKYPRQFVSTIGKSTARALGCQPGSWLSSHAQLYVGFMISALAHIPGDITLNPQWAGYSVPFFIHQAGPVTFITVSYQPEVAIIFSANSRLTHIWQPASLEYQHRWQLLSTPELAPRSTALKPDCSPYQP